MNPNEAAEIKKKFPSSAISTECAGAYSNSSSDGKEVIMLVFEKYYMRNSSRASLSIIVENLSGKPAFTL